MRLDHLLSREQGESKEEAFKPRSIAQEAKAESVKETVEAERKGSGDEGRARKSVLRKNCRSQNCIVFRIPKGSLKGEKSPAHLDNCTEKKTRKSLERPVANLESQLTGKNCNGVSGE